MRTMTNLRTETVTVPDGSFDLHVWTPAAGSGPGLLLLQEIFGVGPYLRDVAERLAALGYVVGAPDVFWRQQRNWEADHDEEGLQASFGLVGAFFGAFDNGVGDCVAAFDRLNELDDVVGAPGVIGFCLGGLLAYHVAACASPAVAVSYYGSNIAASLELAGRISCPILFHFGDSDPYIPNEQVAAITEAFAGNDRATIEVHHAGHAFDNHRAPMFHNPEAAAEAWASTAAFLGRHLPAG